MEFRLFPAAPVLVALLALAAPAGAASSCKMSGLAQLPVTMRGTQPLIAAKINGKDVKFLVDSGAFFSIISPASAEALNLPKTIAPDGFMVSGIGGQKQPMIATVRDFGLAGAVVNNMEFLVAGSPFGGGDLVGMLGQNVFSFADAEYDLGGGAIRMLQAEKCKDADKVYWIKPGQAFSSVTIKPITKFDSQLVGVAYLNGKKIRVIFDTGAQTSVLTVHAAERAGVKTTDAGVREIGRGSGIGSRTVQEWIAPFASFKIGEEEIKDVQLRIADFDLKEADMLLGVDFFLSHRIYVSYGANKVLFTYRGGPVFAAGLGGSTASAEAPGGAVAAGGEPADAQGYSRRGAVFAARGDLPHAIADLTRAIELAPMEAEYFYLRGRFHQDSRQSPLAMNDLDQAISLKSDHLAARVMRGGMRLARLEQTGQGRIDDVVADADAARSVATKEADVHFELGRLYVGAGKQEQAMAEFDQWLEFHHDDTRAPDALANACRARAVLGTDISKALADCNAAVRDRIGLPFPLEARGLVHVRMRNWDKAITDLDKVLAEQPRNVWALYARGLAKLGKGAKADGEKDVEAAKTLNPRVVSNAVSRGFVP